MSPLGTYHYSVHNFSGQIDKRETRVEVIGETARSYKVRYITFGPRNAPPGHVTFVAKRSVVIQGETPRPSRRGGEIEARLPYKD